MMLFISDELQNGIRMIINYFNNQHIRNLWFRYIDYYDINGIYENYYILINHMIMLIMFIYLVFTLIYPRS
jgi:hypothetical protein